MSHPAHVPNLILSIEDARLVERMKTTAEVAQRAYERRSTEVKLLKWRTAARDYWLAIGLVDPIPAPTHPPHGRYC